MSQIKEFIGNEPEQVVEPEAGDTPVKKKKTKKEKGFNPSKFVNVKPEVKEAAKEGVAVISFGRMNPVTTGHEKLVNAVINTALKRGGTPLVYLSHTTDSKKNPLTYDQKIKFAQRAFGPKTIVKSNARTIMQVAQELQNKYKELVVVVGSDRVKEFETLLNKYNGKDYNYDKIEVVSAGERDPDADDVTGMSASKMRALAKDGDMDAFKKGLPRKLQSQAKAVYDAVRAGMKINEEIEELGEALTRQQRLKRKMLMRRMKSKIMMGRRRAMRRKATTQVLQKRAKRLVIRMLKKRFSKAVPYADLPYSARQRIDDRIKKIPQQRLNTLAKRFLPKVKQAERDRFAKKVMSKTPQNPTKPTSNIAIKPTVKKENFNESFQAFLNERLNNQQAETKTDVQLAVETARNLGANMNYAIKEIEKISKGISRHYLVKEALREANESFSENAYQQYTLERRLDEGPSYHAGLAKSTADKRKAQFKKQAKMDDDNPAAYKPAPGDKTAETKPSQHTKKFQKMFGESNYEKAYLRKPHMLLQRNGSVKIDKRFKMFKKAKETDLMLAQMTINNIKEDIDDIVEATEFIFESNPKKSLKDKAEKTGIAYSILKKVFDRGVAAWRTGHRPGTTPTQWGLARVNSFATGGKTQKTTDKDLWDKHKGNKGD